MLKKCLIALLVILAAAAGFYFFYWIRTPAYAAGEIQQAVERHDFQLFRERVDLEKVYGYAIDDLADEAQGSDKREHRIAAGLMKTLKNPLIDEMIRQTEISFNKKGEKDNSPLAAVTRTMKAYVGSAALSLTNIAEIQETNGKALASVRLHDKELNQDFIWKVEMEKDVNGRWTAVRVVNLKDYLAARKKAILAGK